ncbi:MAG TPA: hypothetical protein VEB66_14335 [Opitutaceae bacterium]|nr:hypothetical protein [Opitutaceae bacterium]
MNQATLIRSQPLLKLAVVACAHRRALRGAALPAVLRRRKHHVRRAA